MIEHDLTDPQVQLLMSLRDEPRKLSKHFRPLAPLLEQEYARPRSAGANVNDVTYELTAKGKKLAQDILERLATAAAHKL